jgi:hypothetical protein
MTEQYISGEEFQAMSNRPKKQGHQVTLSTNSVVIVIVIVILCIISFFIGDSYGRDHAKNLSSSNARAFGLGSGFRNRGGFGQVTAVSATNISIQNTRTGITTTYTITPSTTITDNGQTISASGIKTGDTVLVRVASRGSKTATAIMVNPSFGGGPYGGGGGTLQGSNTTGGGSATTGSNTTGSNTISQ